MKDFFFLFWYTFLRLSEDMIRAYFFFGADFLSLHSISHAMLCFWNPSSLLSDSVDFDILCKNKGVYGIFSELRSGDGGASTIGGYKLHTASSTVSARMKKMGPHASVVPPFVCQGHIVEAPFLPTPKVRRPPYLYVYYITKY